MNHISYRRVSTDEQGVSGLGLEAQQEQIRRAFGEPLFDFVEVRSGGDNDRPQLAEALQKCKLYGCFLSISKQDRLSRDVHFLTGLMNQGLDFRAADNPTATDFVKHLFAALGEDERKKIGIRTKEALTALKARGVKLGHNAWTKENQIRLNDILADARKSRVYPKPDPSKVQTLKTLYHAGVEVAKIRDTAELLFGRQFAKSTIYKYLQS